MAQCPRCGGPMPFFGSREMCPACQKQTAPYREKYADLHHEDRGAEGLITKGLVVLNVAVFVMMVLNGVSPVQPQPGEMFRWGSEYGPYTLSSQPWRLLTCMFLHIGIIHLAFNMWCLWDLGQVAERIFGRAWFLVLYLASGICGSYLSLLYNPLRNSAGASGAIFGVCGALIAAFKFGHLAFDPTRVRGLLRSVTLFAIYNLLFGLVGGINNMAHLGGLIGGFVIGFVLTRLFPPYSTAYKASFYWLTPILAIALVGSYFGLRDLKAVQIAAGRAGVNLESNKDCSKAVSALEANTRAHPDDPDAHTELGFCYENVDRRDDAFREYQRATQLNPKDAFAWQQMGWIYLLDKRDTAHAVEAFRKGVEIYPEDAQLRMGLGESLIAAGKIPEGVQEMEQAAKFAPDDPDVLLSLAHAYATAGRVPDEISVLHKLIAKVPNNPEPHERLADALAQSGDEKGAAQERATAQQLQQRLEDNSRR